MRLPLLIICLLSLSGCVTQPQYQWGGYDSLLYAAYKDPSKMEALMVKLEAHIGELEKTNQRVAPGLYAELGTLYLQAGASDKAIRMYARERDAWPESHGLMNAMIKNLERRELSRAEASK